MPFRARRAAILALVLLAAGFVGIELLRRAERPPKIKLTVPDGYRGILVVVESTDAPPTPEPRDGEYVYALSADGVLKVRPDSPHHRWYASAASYESGAPLGVGGSSPAQPYDQEIKLRPLASDSTGRTYYLVGTESEQADAERNWQDRKIGNTSEQTR